MIVVYDKDWDKLGVNTGVDYTKPYHVVRLNNGETVFAQGVDVYTSPTLDVVITGEAGHKITIPRESMIYSFSVVPCPQSSEE